MVKNFEQSEIPGIPASATSPGQNPLFQNEHEMLHFHQYNTYASGQNNEFQNNPQLQAMLGPSSFGLNFSDGQSYVPGMPMQYPGDQGQYSGFTGAGPSWSGDSNCYPPNFGTTVPNWGGEGAAPNFGTTVPNWGGGYGFPPPDVLPVEPNCGPTGPNWPGQGSWPPEGPPYGPPYGGGGYSPSDGQGSGTLTQDGAGKPITYTTPGGDTITINKDTVCIKDQCGKEIEKDWGDPHTEKNGKNTDWTGTTRDVTLDDGTVVHMDASAKDKPIQQTTITNGDSEIKVDNTTNTVTEAHLTASGDNDDCQPGGRWWPRDPMISEQPLYGQVSPRNLKELVAEIKAARDSYSQTV